MKTKKKNILRRGFTLIELLVVILILAILAALIVPKVIGRTDESKVAAAKTDLKSLASSLELFRADCGRYPSTDEGLDALITAPSDVQGWKGPYVKGQGIPLDPWQSPYNYELTGDNTYTITSYGQDKAPGGEGYSEDIVEQG